MESYRKHNSRHHDSRHHKHHKHRHRHHHYRHDEEEHESHRSHQRYHNYIKSSDEDNEYEYNRVSSSRIEKPPSPMQSIWRPSTPPPPPQPPPPPPPPTLPIVEKPKERNWKLMTDPFLSKAHTKIYRYDGIVPNNSKYSEIIVQDPRTFKSKSKTITLPIDLPVPKFKVCISFKIFCLFIS